MRDTVIVTACAREELLYLCLEAIRREDPNVRVCVYSDRGHDSPDLRSTTTQFSAELIVRGQHDHYGNSFNLINAMMREVGDRDVVHLVEEDTILHGGYLAWARARLAARPKVYACVCGRLSEVPNWYESPCVSWDAEHLLIALDYVHAKPAYLTQKTREAMLNIVDEMFPKSKYRRGGAEQDGFFLRVIEHHNWKTRFPDAPLCSHLGFWGYNRPPGYRRPEGSFVDRVEHCRKLFHNLEDRKKLFGHRIANREWSGMNGGQ